MMEAYVDAVVSEIEITPAFVGSGTGDSEGKDRRDAHDEPPSMPLRTIYFGGGTPSLIPLKSLERILTALRRRFGAAQTQEITIEADPGTFDLGTIRAYVDLGITRMSVGVQAFDDDLLSLCGRSHSLYDVYKAIDDIHSSSIPSWSMDLISGLPNLTLDLWEQNVLRAIDAAPKHVSSYDLQVEPKTPFGRMFTPGAAPLPSDGDAASMYAMASAMFRGAGYDHYELSSYALRRGEHIDHRCLHNGVYWDGAGYYGFGMGAASYIGGVRVVRPRRLNAYMDWVEDFEAKAADGVACLPHQDGMRATGKDMLEDEIMLQLRKGRGLRLRERVVDRFVRGEVLGDAILRAVEESVERGLVEVEREEEEGKKNEVVVRLTDPEGFLMSNDVISDVFLGLDEVEKDV